MNKFKLLCSAMLVAGITASGLALADHGHGGHGGGHVGVGLYFGVPYPYGYYPYPYPYAYPYAYPYGYYPPAVVAPAQPPVYVEQGAAPAQQAPAEGNFWYHCSKPEGYYPYIKECPGGWQRVTPTPPSQ